MNEDNQVRNAACQHLAQSAGRKPVFLDVGAMGGPQSPQFEFLCRNDLVTYVGLEPQAVECEKLKKSFPCGIFLQEAVGNLEGEMPLHLTVSPGCISVLEPNGALLKEYPIATCFEVQGKSKVRLTTIRKLVREGRMPPPDFIKCDVQGYDFEVLEGCGDVLDTTLAIEVECQFKQIYKDQKTFFEVKRLLESHGFILRDFRHQGAFEYEVVEVNAFFSKRPHLAGADLPLVKLWEFATRIESPASFAQIKRASGDAPVFRNVTPAMDSAVVFQ